MRYFLLHFFFSSCVRFFNLLCILSLNVVVFLFLHSCTKRARFFLLLLLVFATRSVREPCSFVTLLAFIIMNASMYVLCTLLAPCPYVCLLWEMRYFYFSWTVFFLVPSFSFEYMNLIILWKIRKEELGKSSSSSTEENVQEEEVKDVVVAKHQNSY